MKHARTIIILRSVLAAIMTGVAIVSFAAGRPVMGVLFAAFAATNIALTVVFHRRQRDLEARFPAAAAASGVKKS